MSLGTGIVVSGKDIESGMATASGVGFKFKGRTESHYPKTGDVASKA
jgi:hypothetical protein